LNSTNKGHPSLLLALANSQFFLIFLTKRFNPHSYLPRFSSMGFIRSAGFCTHSGSDVYRTSDKTLFITFTMNLIRQGRNSPKRNAAFEENK